MIAIQVISTMAGLNDMAVGWHRLADKCATTPFQTYPWMKSWWSLVGQYDASVEPHIVMVNDSSGICAIAPFMVRDEGDGAVLRFATDPWADYQGILLDRTNPNCAAVLAAIGDHVLAGVGQAWGAVDLDEISPWSDLVVPDSAASEVEPSSISYRLALGDVETVARMREGRREHLLKRRQLARLGALRFTIHAEPEALSARMPTFMAMHLRQWMPRADREITFDDPDLIRCYSGIAERMGNAGLLGLAELSLDGRPLAFHLGFCYRGTFWAYCATFEASARRYSPGHLLVQSLIETLAASGFHTIDFMRGDHAYKQEYSNKRMVNRRVRVPAGRLTG